MTTNRAPIPSVDRRTFAIQGALGALVLLLPGCSGALSGAEGERSGAGGESNAGAGGTGRPQGGRAGSSGGGASGQSGSPGGGVAGSAGSGSIEPTCGELTAPNIEGPFFKPSSPERRDIRLDAAGPRISISGRVLSTDCQPIADAVLDFWQANEDGAYDNQGQTFRGHQRTGKDGRYRLDTIIPGRYLNGRQYRPAHIHVKVAAAGHALLTTQLYFEDDPFNEVDPFIESSLIMSHGPCGADGHCAVFDFVVAAV